MQRLERFLERWPAVLVWSGMLLFWATCLYSDHLPEEALFVGPLTMLSGVLVGAYNKRQR
jgi:hypothetical protein